MSQAAKFLCGVPRESCTGGILHTDQTFKSNKCHTTRKEARNCMAKYLEKMRFTKIGPRIFVNPENGYIRILPKVSKFGGRLRRGKSTKGEGASRFEPLRGSGLVY